MIKMFDSNILIPSAGTVKNDIMESFEIEKKNEVISGINFNSQIVLFNIFTLSVIIRKKTIILVNKKKFKQMK